jgi:hypothetical protein
VQSLVLLLVIVFLLFCLFMRPLPSVSLSGGPSKEPRGFVEELVGFIALLLSHFLAFSAS